MLVEKVPVSNDLVAQLVGLRYYKRMNRKPFLKKQLEFTALYENWSCSWQSELLSL